jgi:hypothetical protein
VNAILNADRTLKNQVSITEEMARSGLYPVDITETDIFIEKAPPAPDGMYAPRLSLDGTGWEEANPTAAADKLLSELVESKLSAISNSMDAALSAGFTCANGITMDATDADVRKLDDGTRLATRLGMATMDIRDANNVRHLGMPVTDVEAMVAELGVNWMTQWSTKCSLQESIMSIANDPVMTDVEKVAAIDGVTW